MSAVTLVALCQRVPPELACLGELGKPLLETVTVVERTGAARDVSALADPGFALEVLTSVGIRGDAAVIGRVLDFLRLRAEAGAIGPISAEPTVTATDAVDLYEGGALALMARGTQHTYRTWTRRLIEGYGDRAPSSVTAGDLTDLIAKHVLAARSDDERCRSGPSCGRRTQWPPTGTCDGDRASMRIASYGATDSDLNRVRELRTSSSCSARAGCETSSM